MGKRDRNRLRVLRAERRISQMDTAAKSGVTVGRIWRIENGYDDPTPAERAALAKFFRVDEQEIFPAAVAS